MARLGHSSLNTSRDEHLVIHDQLADKANYVFDVKDYGAVGDGATDDTTAIQDAIDAAGQTLGIASSSPFTVGAIVDIPDGEYLISSPIEVTSNSTLRFYSKAARIVEGASFSGTELLQIKGIAQPTTTWASAITIKGGTLKATTSGVAGIRQNTDYFIYSTIEDMTFFTNEEIVLDRYTQGVTIQRIMSRGSVDKCLHLKGNDNVIDGYRKEGGTGTSTDPYFFVESYTYPVTGSASGNTLRNLVIEGSSTTNKTPIKLDGATRTQIENLWVELTSTDGYVLRITDSHDVRLSGFLRGFYPGGSNKMLITDSVIDIPHMEIWVASGNLDDVIEVSGESVVNVGSILTTRNENAHLLSQLDDGLYLNGPSVSRTALETPVTGNMPSVKVTNRRGGNLLLNPSFESGRFAWGFDTAVPDTTEEYITSEVADGLMGHFKWSTLTSTTIRQVVGTIPTEWVGRRMTFTALVKIANGAGAFASVFFTGAGVSEDPSNSRVMNGDGWGILSKTFIPQSSGSFRAGIRCSNIDSSTDIYVDEAYLGFGTDGISNNNQFGSLEIGPATNTRSLNLRSSAPTTGTHKVGDVVFNSSPTAGGTMGWVCTTAGSPGTWKTWGAVST